MWASKVRISVVPPISSVTTSRSPATPVETMRAPFGRVAVTSVGDSASLGAEKTIADGDQNGGDRQRRGQARDQHQPPHPREQARPARVSVRAQQFRSSRLSSQQGSSLEQGVSSNSGQRLEVTVAGDEGSARLDRVLAVRRPDLSRSRLKALILAGSVAIKGAAGPRPRLSCRHRRYDHNRRAGGGRRRARAAKISRSISSMRMTTSSSSTSPRAWWCIPPPATRPARWSTR